MGQLASSLFGNYYNCEEPELDFAEIDKDIHIDDVVKKEFPNLDDHTKALLINHIKQLKNKNINFPNDFMEKIKDVELDNSKLLPMALELYQKVFDIVGEHKYVAVQGVFKKKQFFVRPKFDEASVKKSIEDVVLNISVPITEELFKINQPLTDMKGCDITVTEFNDSFNETLTKKDMLGISKKLLRDMPNYLKIRFINIFNLILKDPTKVKEHSLGKGSYMYKAAKHGPTNDINSFRQIVSIPNVVNQFHRILCLRLNAYMHLNKLIDTNIQKGGIAGQKFAIFEQYYKVKNVLKDANKNKKSCAILFIDLSNAFGNLDLSNLYKILEFYSVDKNFVNYVKEFYDKFEYYVDTANIKTDAFKWKNGLIQGCSLSPVLFIIALNYVLSYVDNDYKNACGYTFNDPKNIKILLTAFVDDISIICKDVASVELVYKRLTELLKVLGLPVNKSKCALMVVNDNTKVTGELAQIQKVNMFKYLGEYISSDGSCTESYIQTLRGLSRKLKTIDSKNLNHTDKLKLFTVCVMPWLQRRTLAMYDITMTNRLKIVSIVKPYIEKWGGDGNLNIFSNVTPILNNSTDSVISNVTFEDDDFDEDLEKNIEIANYVLKDANVKIEYSQIDDEFQLDAELLEYDEIAQD